jgi:hypothetical protein
MRHAIVFTLLLAACASEAPPAFEQSSISSTGSTQTSSPAARCDALSSYGPELRASDGQAEVSGFVAGDNLLLELGGRSCELVDAQGFSLKGCMDWYECGGCIIELREEFGGKLRLEGHSEGEECRDLYGRFELHGAE